MSSAVPAVDARGWSWRHWGRERWAVRGLDLRIEPGERVLLLGPSGAGKSTLLHGLAGVLGGEEEGLQEGELRVAGLAPERARGHVGLVLQDPESQVILPRIGDDVAFGCENLGVPPEEIWSRVGAALDSVGLGLPLDHATNALSGGQQQRLALAGVLAMRPQLLLLDEPTANLDPEGVAEVRATVGRVVEETGATLVVIEHRVSVWRDLVDRVVVLAPGGGVLADGPTDVVLREQGAALAAAGVWVPGFPPAVPSRIRPGVGEVLLRAERLGVGRARDRLVAADIDLELRAGEALAVTGPNGAGKSTLGLTLGGLLAPHRGEVFGTPPTAGGESRPARWRSRELVTRIGTVFQEPAHQFLAASVREELELGPRTVGLDPVTAAARIDGLVERLRLGALLDANPFTLSGGEQRRLSVATALTTRPPVVVLDEPTFGQDARTWEELVALLAELLDEGSALVAITHDADVVTGLADRELRAHPGAPGRFEAVR